MDYPNKQPNFFSFCLRVCVFEAVYVSISVFSFLGEGVFGVNKDYYIYNIYILYI